MTRRWPDFANPKPMPMRWHDWITVGLYAAGFLLGIAGIVSVMMLTGRH